MSKIQKWSMCVVTSLLVGYIESSCICLFFSRDLEVWCFCQLGWTKNQHHQNLSGFKQPCVVSSPSFVSPSDRGASAKHPEVPLHRAFPDDWGRWTEAINCVSDFKGFHLQVARISSRPTGNPPDESVWSYHTAGKEGLGCCWAPMTTAAILQMS